MRVFLNFQDVVFVVIFLILISNLIGLCLRSVIFFKSLFFIFVIVLLCFWPSRLTILLFPVIGVWKIAHLQTNVP